MPIFQDLFGSPRNPKGEARSREGEHPHGPETAPVKMNLEERMAFRRELLFETVKFTLNGHFIPANSYRFKVMRTDKRGHCYVVMLDMSPAFMASEHGEHKRLAETAADLTKNALARYGLVINGVYWRIDETLAATVADWAKPLEQTQPLQVATPVDPHSLVSSNIEKYERATAEQLAEFEAAWQQDGDIHIGDRTYSSDLAPLGEDPPQH